MALGIIGFLSTNQMALDMQDVITGMEETVKYPPILSAQVNGSLGEIQSNLDGQIAKVNDRLAGRLIVNQRVAEMNATLEALDASLGELSAYIEGEKAGNPNPCQFKVNGTAVWWNSAGFWQSGFFGPLVGVRCCSAGGPGLCVEGVHEAGSGTPINGRPAVACRTFDLAGGALNGESAGACPCCCECAEQRARVHAVLHKMPEPLELAALEQPMNASLFADAIDDAQEAVAGAIAEFDATFTMFNEALQPAKAALGDEATVIGGAASVWAIAWVALLLALLALIFASACCWWMAYALGVIVVVVHLVLFGVSSLVVLPFGDICVGMPVTGEDPNAWLLTFSTTNRIADVDAALVGLYTDCLVLSAPDGALWTVVGMDRANLSAAFSPLLVSNRISPNTIAATLDAPAYTAQFTEGAATMERLQVEEAAWGLDREVLAG
eukprot:CAMPEP_0181314928 /NCGR_PEP_ID=MMETSP1101-20121128/15088_1 /TAXON_ID=46948 /ORGANISM="Rhodomonas abbreviata, Strain Caron Lab Isolate" /LENGTH=438 /DNA_ID=CAMNT_0023422071 /DNA_START=758 /DNA_END=2070 /DNA_ORIENTATION=+